MLGIKRGRSSLLTNHKTRTQTKASLRRNNSQFILTLLAVLWVGLANFVPVFDAKAEVFWQDISSKVTIDTSNPIRSRRAPNATVIIQITNNGSEALNSPLRLVLGNFTPTTVSLQGASGSIDSGDPYLDLTPYVGDSLAVGATTGSITLTILGGGPTNFSFFPRVEQQQIITEPEPLAVQITEPDTLITVGSTPIQVLGSINDPDAALTVNGAPINHSGGTFSAAVSLEEGHNTIVARAVNTAGQEVTDSISVSMDLTPPYITAESPEEGQTVSTSTIAVSGLVNDIVRGTVSADQANVRVNGIPAAVSNRSYLVENVPLTEGDNDIVISASDQVGNTSTLTITVRYIIPAPKHIELLAGQNQIAQIRSSLTDPLAVKLIDSDGVTPVANKSVVFRVIQGDGLLAPDTENEGQAVLATSDVNGVAQSNYKLGSRSGNGNQRVRARAVGFDGEVVFYASATPKPGDKVSINSGNNQRGAINQPLPQPFVVAVTDEGANVIQGTEVEFKVNKGGGVFQNGLNTIVAITDSDGRATAHMTLGPDVGLDVHRVTATIVGTIISAGFTASGLQAGDPGNTRITGVVMDNQDTPLPGVTLRVDGTTRQAITDQQGRFTITEVPVGPVHLIADGSTTSVPGEWPTLSYNLVTVAGAVNPLAAPIYMVKLDTTNAASVGGAQEVTLTLPEVPGFALTIKPNSVTFPDGSNQGLISVTPVNASKVPMAPPNGMQPQFIVTIQPAGAKFDPPAPLSLPNVDGHSPGAQVEMYSYDHDLEEFVSIGLGTVSADGSVIDSNPGIGVVKAGWHCGSQPSGSGCTHNCPVCKDCKAPECICNINKDNDPRVSECKKCSGGSEVTDATKNGQSCDGTECKKCKNGACKPIGFECVSNTNTNFTDKWTTVTLSPSMTVAATTLPKLPSFKTIACLDTASGKWNIRITSAIDSGEMKIVPTPAANTPNPVTKGNIVNKAGDVGHYCDVIADLADYTKNGKKGPNWHVTQATIDHEEYHRDTDWKANLNKEWTNIENDMESHQIDCKDAKDAAAALSKLQPLAQQSFNAGITKVVNSYNNAGDGPGDPPYVAGQKALNDMIVKIEKFAKDSGWPACP